MKHTIKATIYTLALAPLFAMASAEDVAKTLKNTYPNTTFNSVKNTPINGVYQVTMGKNIAYVQEDGRYFIFGNLFDMQTNTDLTAVTKADLQKVAFKDLPFKNAITMKKGNGGKGQREFALFSDPECPFCRQLEETLAGMDNVTIHLFLYPIASLHPIAVSKAEDIWCAKDSKKAWLDYMLLGKDVAKKTCKNPIQDNINLAASLEIRGTPTMIHKDGRITAGAMPRAQLEKWLDGDM